MKNRLVSAFLIPFMLGIGVIQSGCFGSFALISKAHGFVDGIGGDDLGGRFIRTLIMYAGGTFQVWSACILVDVAILNLIEFWTGSNPLAMQEGEMEQQYVMYEGEQYLITATKNQFKFEKLSGETVLEESLVQFCEDDQSWSYVHDGESHILTAFRGLDEDQILQYEVYTADGSEIISTKPLEVARI